ncbi:MAG: efflux transporter outer membrane subunit [Bacteroidota bacterium]
MRNISLIAILALVLVSCGVTKRDFGVESKVDIKEDFLVVEEEHFVETAPISDWWTAFNDPILDTLIRKAKDHNLDVNVAVANVFASRALLKETQLDRIPTVTANGNYNRTRLGENIFTQGTNPTFNTFSGSFDAFWETDLFGRVSNRVKGAYANQQLLVADMQGVYVSVFAEVARNYMEFRGAQYQLDIANRNLKDQEETYALTVQLSEAGTSNSLDVSRALAQLESTKAIIPQLQARIEALKNSLSVLIGEVPGNLEAAIIDKQPLPNLPSSVAVGSVKDLLRRRPDVRRVEAELQVQIAQYNLSVAELYPNIQFGGSIGFSAVDFSNFGSKESFTWSVIPSISWAAFNIGRVRRQIDQEDALTLAALSRYEQTVLEALEEIRTAMSNFTKELERRERLRESAQASSQAATFAQQRYTAGLDSFIDYLSADASLLQAENQLANSEITAATSLIAIYKALGGGWEIVSEEELQQKFETMKLAEANLR